MTRVSPSYIAVLMGGWFTLMLSLVPLKAEVQPAELELPQAEAWTGEGLSFYVKLRAKGSFSGAAGFSIPEIPGAIILKVGNPVVGSETLDGESWFVQTHEFTIFSQADGAVKIPSFEVRFSSRDGFTGPVKDQTLQVPGTTINIRRPTGTESLGSLVTTTDFEVKETWDSTPAEAQAGTVLRRTISQRAEQLPGMVLMPAPHPIIPGVRTYPSPAEVSEKTERGSFSGKRSETLTYLLQEPGTTTLPEITYSWWNPERKELLTKTLPSLTIQVTPSAEQLAKQEAEEAAANPAPPVWPWLSGAALALGLALWQRRTLQLQMAQLWQMLNPLEPKLARAVLRASRRNDAQLTSAAWFAWLAHSDHPPEQGSALASAVIAMQSHCYGRASQERWQGSKLAKHFREHRAQTRSSSKKQHSQLPPLNIG